MDGALQKAAGLGGAVNPGSSDYSVSADGNSKLVKEAYKSNPVIPAQAGIPFPWGKVGWGSQVPCGTVLWVPAPGS